MPHNTATIAPGSHFSFTALTKDAGQRLDIFITHQFPHHSRSFFKNLFEQRLVTVNGALCTKTGYILKTNDVINITFPEKRIVNFDKEIECINSSITIIYQHTDFAIIYKPAGLLVHATSTKQAQFSLVDWLIHHFESIKDVGTANRPGIIHRLDKDTSGLMIVALNNRGHQTIGALFQHKTIEKTYLALVTGHPDKTGSLHFPIKRHATLRNRMTHAIDGRPALTHFSTLSYFKDCSLVLAKPVTGRTHQIRVHFAQQGHALLGDTIYGTSSPFINRQALHSYSIAFDYDNTHYFFQAPLPADFYYALTNIVTYSKVAN